MFFVADVQDQIRVDPGDLGRPVLDAVTSVIERLYIDKARLVGCPFLSVFLESSRHA